MYGFKHQFCADDTCILLVQQSNGVYTVGDFMTRKENLHVVKPTTSVDEGTSTSQCDAHACFCIVISEVAHFCCFFVRSPRAIGAAQDFWLPCG